ncbi:ATP-binding protein [Yinghuangia sp. ASG 101]|uniref:AAA family ATPase n=1 Tax=Yinghuangia sp. ASG 101 TaxID=2896848 RepID=UPI001E4C1041|nr:AAA family ATPase [Yinghuangia sp. ASG 101]UGQ10494.1 ATP-binding protein [Yinghuangia sp. ASG 101]
MIVQLAGLPGAGKTTVAEALAERLGDRAVHLDKDRVRNAHFGILTEYTRSQDDFCMELVYATAAWHLSRRTNMIVILDGRTCSRRYQINRTREFARYTAHPLHVIECVCREETAHARLARGTDQHPAANRDFALYQRLRDTSEPLVIDRLRLDTDQPVAQCVGRCLEFLFSRGSATQEVPL